MPYAGLNYKIFFAPAPKKKVLCLELSLFWIELYNWNLANRKIDVQVCLNTTFLISSVQCLHL